MAIEKKLICFARLEEFERQLAAGNILDYSIVFIQDAKKIWTRGTYYDCNGGLDNVYITDFTVNDLENTIGSGLDVVADLTSLEEALVAHKVILVPYNADDGYLGYGFLTGYAEDLLYCTVYVGFDGLFYEIEATRGDTAIRGQSIFKRTWSDKQDRLVSGTNIKTINGTSILGSGNIEIEGGETLTESDIAAMGFTKNTGTYSKPSGGIPSSDLDTATQNILQAADENHELIQDFNVDIAQLQDNKQDKLVSGTNIKTINGESIVGSGNIVIEGGEDIRYFTEFTVEQVVAAGNMLSGQQNSELYVAAENNKLICIPCQDGLDGFIVASYEVKLDNRGHEELYVSFIYETTYYRMLVMPNALDISIQPLSTRTVFVDSGLIDVYDNTSYVVTTPVTGVYIQPITTLNVGSTIRFTTGEDCSLTIYGNPIWANGVIPTIESGVTYELSIIRQSIAGSSAATLAVLVPFKPVE